MDKVIGLGKMGCGIAEELTEHPEYRIYKIGSHLSGRGDLVIDEPTDIQTSEESIDVAEIAVYLRSIRAEDEVLFIVGGGEPISGINFWDNFLGTQCRGEPPFSTRKYPRVPLLLWDSGERIGRRQ
jgi:hypothetical protein